MNHSLELLGTLSKECRKGSDPKTKQIFTTCCAIFLVLNAFTICSSIEKLIIVLFRRANKFYDIPYIIG